MPIEGSSTDKGITIELTGFSGDFLRTCFFYNIPDNNHDYVIKDAFLIEDQERIHCLFSSHRKIDNGEKLTWIEFSAIPPDTRKLELHITKLQHSPTEGAFKLRGDSFVDPWAPALKHSREVFNKVVGWSRNSRGLTHTQEDWEVSGSWEYELHLGQWDDDKKDRIKPLDFHLTFGRETVHFLEFRNSNTGAFIAFESCDEIMRKMRNNFREEIFNRFKEAESMEEFETELSIIGLNKGYIPVQLNLSLKDNSKKVRYLPDFIDSVGVINNRIYNFFDDCIRSDQLEILIDSVSNLKLDSPMVFEFDFTSILHDEPHTFDIDTGSLHLKGEIHFSDIVMVDGHTRLTYTTKMKKNIDCLVFEDASLSIQQGDDFGEEIPTMGSKVPPRTCRKRINNLEFATNIKLDSEENRKIKLTVYSVNVKLKDPIKLGFEVS
ncbi:MAG: hypothetical protein ACLFQV_01595 [Vulcanimicrobiota bacterium]